LPILQAPLIVLLVPLVPFQIEMLHLATNAIPEHTVELPLVLPVFLALKDVLQIKLELPTARRVLQAKSQIFTAQPVKIAK
jgi:hypothetical protein